MGEIKIAKLYNFVSPPVAVTRNVLTQRLQSVRKIITYNKIDNIGYGRKRLKDIVEVGARKQQEKPTEQKDQAKTKPI